VCLMKASLTCDLAMMATFSKHTMSSVRKILDGVLRSLGVLVALARVEVWRVVGVATMRVASSGMEEIFWAPPLAMAKSGEDSSRTVKTMLSSRSDYVVVSLVRRSLGLMIETYRSGGEGHAGEHEEVDEDEHDSEVLERELHGRCV
jgi:hypothetical protein